MSSGARARTTRSRPNGWYALCDVPSSGELVLSARLDAASTDLIPFSVDPYTIPRRDLFLGTSRYVEATARDTADGSSALDGPLRTGDGRLSGTVRTEVGDQPLPAAQALIVDGVPGVADARGEFSLTEVPAGSRLLNVRAVGYFPERVVVDVIDGAPPITVALRSISSVLDSVRIVADRTRSKNLIGFDERRASSTVGQFLTKADVARRVTAFTSDILTALRGVQIVRRSDGQQALVMRRSFGRGVCLPAIFIDAVEMNIGDVALTLDELNDFARKQDIEGIEVYHDGDVPPQFQSFDTMGSAGCGAIVLWSRP